jgi:hypothetical protein
MTTKIDVRAYASELLFHAAVSTPWSVAEETFVAVIAMLSDGTPLTPVERDDVTAFFALACDYAADGGSARWDVATVYQQASETAKARGQRIFGDRAPAL